MADTVTTTTILDSLTTTIVHLTNSSDGSGESAVTKIDVSELVPAAAAVAIEKIIYSTEGMSVDLLWDATADGLIWRLPADSSDTLEFGLQGALKNPRATGFTGDIKLTTVGHTSGDRYAIWLHLRKESA